MDGPQNKDVNRKDGTRMESSVSVLYEVECRGCHGQFFVAPAHQGVTLCQSCEALKELLGTRPWEPVEKRQERQAFIKWLMLVAAVVIVIVVALVLANPQ
jgi:hypothetical protein